MPHSILRMLRLKFVIVDCMFATDYYTSAIDGYMFTINDYISANAGCLLAIAVYIPAIDSYTFAISDFRLAINDCKPVLQYFK